jgi:hypothetical protein
MINYHIQQVQGLQHVPAYFGPWLFYAIDDVGLQAEFFSKNLHNDTGFAIISSFKNDAPRFMQHDG